MIKTLRKIKEILQAYIRLLTTKYTVEEQNKLNICKQCPRNKFNICKECGCLTNAKVKSPLANCPLNKWKQTLTKEDILNELNNRFK